MKTLMLVVVIGQLLFIISAAYQFGDIISFKRYKCPCLPAVYKHYAVYVDDEQFDGKLQDQDIFHFTGEPTDKKNAACKFGKLSETIANSPTSVDNYLDDKLIPGNHEEMKERIKEKIQECGKYHVIKNNCEHLATDVRYGEAISKQYGTLAWPLKWCQNMLHKLIGKRDVDEISLPIEAEFTSCEELCSSSSSGPSSSKKSPGKKRRSLRASG